MRLLIRLSQFFVRFTNFKIRFFTSIKLSTDRDCAQASHTQAFMVEHPHHQSPTGYWCKGISNITHDKGWLPRQTFDAEFNGWAIESWGWLVPSL